ncbi:MAG: phosphoglucosamine mutase [Planctomycetota bacterium]|nr:phosphoglucosamine mutase [Planctomycetota bacterium]MDI6788831.1 phosphoglucosamine mutase [Planctomycetota bacterium]
MTKIFGTDGIRDVAGKGYLSPDFLIKLGRVIGSKVLGDSSRRTAIIGRDTRPSGLKIERILSRALTSTGVKVVKAGIISTPGLAYLTHKNRCSIGIMISASHNPAHYNGIKLFAQTGLKISSAVEDRIEKYLTVRQSASQPVNRSASQTGRQADRQTDRQANRQTGQTEYINHMIKSIDALKPNWAKGIKTVLDCANGALYKIAPEVFKRIGATVISINNSNRGENINRRCGALYPETLKNAVRKTSAHLGLSFDGDGDRVIMVDEEGVIRDGDFILYAGALYLKGKNHLSKNTVVGTIMTNSALENTLAQHQIKLVRTPVGDRYVLEKMLKGGFSLGGEPSGHIIFSDYSKNGDGVVTALMVLKIMIEQDKSLNELSKGLVKYPQIIVNVPVKSKPPLENIKPLQKKIREVERSLSDKGRLVIRYSGTESLLRIMIEGESKRKIKLLAHRLEQTIKNTI